MDGNAIIQAISAVGFPIVMCVLLLYYVRSLQTSHQDESEKFTDALNRHTLVLQRLCDKIGGERLDDDK